ncbi:MAG: transporter substrate-binding domain-containing protein [SAR324 cluster bacterium]|nr:transporter substrate-binding domain-containing protein [SAR324 cluster bacterium]
MKRLLVFGLFFLYSLPLLAGEIKTIHVVSEEWEEATNKDGTGLYWDIFRAIYTPHSIKLTTQIVPYARSVTMVQQKKADVFVAAYKDEVNGVLYSKWHFDVDNVSALFIKGKIKEWKGPETLRGKRVGWIHKYKYDQYLSVKVEKREVKHRVQALSMLQKGRLDFFIDAVVDLEDELKNSKIADQFEMKAVMSLNLYMCFAQTKQGELLRDLFDQGMDKLLKSGELKALYDKWEWGDVPF